MTQRFPLALVAILAAAPAVAGPADGAAEVTLLPGWRMEGGTHMAGIRIDLAPGWKTYWRAPGPLGIPPELSLRHVENVGRVEMTFPAPQVLADPGGTSIGYTDSVVLPLRVAVPRAGRPAILGAELWVGLCRDICVPGRFDLTGELPADGDPDPAIEAALAAGPVALGPASCRIETTASGLTVRMEADAPFRAEAGIIEVGDAGLWVSETRAAGNGAAARIEALDGGPVALDRSGLRLTLLGRGQAAEAVGCGG